MPRRLRTADLNGDGITGTADLLLFLVEWGG